ncbi:MAG TPA: HAD family hydrolase [Dehalococcoidales bacterium]|nr:HAD family hydrolase [Dehalococcoidales bacterium]
MSKKAVLFDLDGTLLDTLQDLAEAVNQGLESLGLPQHEIAAYRYFVGEGREEMVRKALPDSRRDAFSMAHMLDFVNRYYHLHWKDHTHPYEGIPELLDSLNGKGIPMSVFSNKPQEFTTQCISGLLSGWNFTHVLGASDEVPKKPDCTAALRIASDLGIKPGDFLYLGDSGVDMQTALRAGMYGVGALWGFRTRQELMANGARALIHHPLELIDLL